MQAQCIVCVLNQIQRLCQLLDCDERLTRNVFIQAARKISEMDFFSMTAPEFAEYIYDIFTEESGNRDPYKELRKSQNEMVLNQIDYFRKQIERSPDPLYMAIFYALLGNIIDYGNQELYNPDILFKKYHDISITLNDFPVFREKYLVSNKILVVADNAGEAVFDFLLLEEMKRLNPRACLFYAVRSKPAINDVLKLDAESIGIDRYATILESGSTFAGTRLHRANDIFKSVYYSADLVISKGQGNFETLETEPENILFVFKVKCATVAKHIGLKNGDLIMAFRDTIRNSREEGSSFLPG